MTDRRRCGANNHAGQPCGAQPLLGTDPPRCRHHAGRKTAVVKAEYAVRQRADRLFQEYNLDDLDDPLSELERLAREVLAWKDVCRRMVGDLTELRYKSKSAGEQLRAEIVLFERSMDRAARVLVDLIRLDIEQRIIHVKSAINAIQIQRFTTALEATLRELRLDHPAVRPTLAKHLRIVANNSQQHA